MADSQKATVSITRKQSFQKRVELLRSERSSFIPLWRELSDFHLAHRGRFLVSDRNKGHKRNTKQINNTSRLAVRTLASGMMAGITSPARPWFKLGISNKALMSDPTVKVWLLHVEKIIREIFNQSNLYNALHTVYQELGVFGTATMGIFEDYENVIRCKPYTVGSYFLGTDGYDRVDTWAREYELTVGQLVKRFGLKNCSKSVQKQWETGSTEEWVTVVHLIEPNDDRDRMNPLAKHMKFRSVYYEKTSPNLENCFLLESGFRTFPILAPRWEVTGEDIYGVACPGMDSLGDGKGLQLAEKMKYEAIEKHVDPHLVAPTSLRNVVSKGLLPGDISFVDGNTTEGLRPVYQVNPNLNYHNADIEKVEDRIDRAFYVDLFLMLANSDRRQITAREIAERHEEKLLMLGPVLERLHNELLDPLIDRTFEIGLEAGIFGKIPDVLSEQEIKIEYVSVLAQAQRIVATGNIEQVAGYIGQLSAVWPEARHKFNATKSVEEYADATGVSPDLIRSDDEVSELMAQEAQQIQQQQMMEKGADMAKSAKTLSETDVTNTESALNRLMGGAGYSVPQAATGGR